MNKLLLFLIPLSTAHASFTFIDKPGETGYCSPDRIAKVGDIANAFDDEASFARDKIVSFAGANPPPSDGYRAEIEYWLGDMPTGDPTHPSPELTAWQWKLEIAADNIGQARTALGQDIIILCVTDGFPACAVGAKPTMMDDFDDPEVGAFSTHLNVGGKLVPTVGLCEAFWKLEVRGQYVTQAPILGHELAHLFSGLSTQMPVEDYVYGLLDAHDFAKDDKAPRNAANLQFLLGGLDNRRSGGAGSGAVDVMVRIAMAAGCSVTGHAAQGAFLVAILFLVLLGRRRTRHLPVLLVLAVGSASSDNGCHEKKEPPPAPFKSIYPDSTPYKKLSPEEEKRQFDVWEKGLPRGPSGSGDSVPVTAPAQR